MESLCFDSDDHLGLDEVSAINNMGSQQDDVRFERGRGVYNDPHREIGTYGVTVDLQIQEIRENVNNDRLDVSCGNDKVKLDVLVRQCVEK